MCGMPAESVTIVTWSDDGPVRAADAVADGDSASAPSNGKATAPLMTLRTFMASTFHSPG